MKRKLLFLSLVVLISQSIYAQKAPYRDDIDKYKRIDSLQAPPQNAILFVGSSSFTLWENLPGWFPGLPVINRGFGGSTIPEVEYYADEIIFPYKPSQIVFYCGENDLMARGVTVPIVVDRFKKLFEKIRAKMPGVPFVFVSMKPSISRAHLLSSFKEANTLIENYLKQFPNTAYVDVFEPMLQSDGTPRPEIFAADKLHMNKLGYDIWKAVLEPVLIR